MDTTELLKKVRRIEIKTRGLSRNIFAGQYHSAFKGRGMAFSEVREYQFGERWLFRRYKTTIRSESSFFRIVSKSLSLLKKGKNMSFTSYANCSILHPNIREPSFLRHCVILPTP